MKIYFEKNHISIISPKLTWLCGLFSGTPKKARAAAFFPFITFCSKEEQVPWIINHELIHFRQQLETLFIGLWILEIVETVYALLVLKKSFPEAYRWRSSEQEAYRNQHNSQYLSERKLWSVFHYMKNKKELRFGRSGEIIFQE